MGSGKLDKKGRQRRRENLIRYIKENGPVTSAQICAEFGTSRSSLSDDLRAINLGGDIILSPSRGTYIFNGQREERSSPRCRIDRESVRQWAILLALSRHDLTYSELADFLEGSGIHCTATSLYKDLAFLQQEGLLARRSEGRRRYYHSEALCQTDVSEIRRYYRSASERNVRLHIEDLQTLNIKIRHCVNFAGCSDIAFAEDSTIASGKKSLITREQLKMLESFEQYPFADKVLKIRYNTNAGIPTDCFFQTGLIVYNVETSRIYLIGKNLKQLYSIIPLDRIVSIAATRRNNVCYDTSDFHTLLRQMFQISADPPVKVRVRFENYTFVRDKIERLCRIRSSGKMEIQGDEIIYTDVIRGEGDFARYLRKFGRSVIVDAPESLRQRMIGTSRLTINRYSDISSGKELSQ